MPQKLIIAISGSGANDAIRGMVAAYTDPIVALGLPVVHVTAEEAELRYATQQIAEGNVAFGITWLGIGQVLPVRLSDGSAGNAWDVYSTPLLKIHGDIPAYFQDFHRDIPRATVNLYGAEEFVAFRRRWMPESRAMTAVLPPFPIAPVTRQSVNVGKRRTGKLVFLKNGNSPLALRSLWSERLPASVARLLVALSESITQVGTRPGRLLIGDYVADFLRSQGIEAETLPSLVAFFTAQMDDWLRRIKSEMIADALLDLPVVIQGDQWDHIDFHNRRAMHVQGQDYSRSQAIYADQLGVIDMSPNIDTGGHERVLRAAGAFSIVLTNRQGWITKEAPGFDDLMYEFSPDSIADRVADVVAHPDRYLELGFGFGERIRERFPAHAYADRLIDIAELAALHYGQAKPQLQPFFVWPRVGS